MGDSTRGETDGKTLTFSAVLILAVIFHLHHPATYRDGEAASVCQRSDSTHI